MEYNLIEQTMELMPPAPPLDESHLVYQPELQEPQEQQNIIVPSIAHEIMLQLQHPDTIEQNLTESPPPLPLPPRNLHIIPGVFDYIKNEREKIMLENAWQAITLTENWSFIKQDTESFMWSSDQRINIISDKMEKLGYNGHSGFSFGWTMRQMQYIARYGEEKYKEMYLSDIRN